MENKPGVFINDHGHARWRNITLGMRGVQHVEVVQGIAVGEQIVRPAPGQKPGLTEGQCLTLQ